MSFLINPVRAHNGALLKFYPVLCGGAAAVYIWTVEPLPHLALGISEPLVRQLIDDRTWINSRMINAQVVEQQSLVSLNESWLRSSCKHYVLLIDAFYDPSNLIYAFVFIQRSMMFLYMKARLLVSSIRHEFLQPMCYCSTRLFRI